jgi:hypothetical protein
MYLEMLILRSRAIVELPAFKQLLYHVAFQRAASLHVPSSMLCIALRLQHLALLPHAAAHDSSAA